MSGTVTDGSLLLAMPLAALAGLVSFLSPCVLPLVPGYLAYTTGLSAAEVFDDAGRRRGRLVLGALLFVAGFTFVFVSAGVLLGGLGGFLLENQDVLRRVLGAVTIVLGLAFVGFLPWLQRDIRIDRKPAVGLLGAPVLGMVFGLGWSPCLGPTLAAVFALGLGEGTAAARRRPRRGVLPRARAAVRARRAGVRPGDDGVRLGQEALRRRDADRGAMLVVIGVLLVTGVWDSWVSALQVWVNGFTVAV